MTLEIKGIKLTLQSKDIFMHKDKEYKIIKLGNIQPIDYKMNKGIKRTYKRQKNGIYKKIFN